MPNVVKFLPAPTGRTLPALLGRRPAGPGDRRTLAQLLGTTFGLGAHRLARLCALAAIPGPHRPATALTRAQAEALARALGSRFLLGRRAEKRMLGHVLDQARLRSYRAYRLLQGLPVRNQRTHTNAATCRRRPPALLRTVAGLATAGAAPQRRRA
jgi:ribosomal protein S13